MQEGSGKSTLYISIAVILSYWGYSLFAAASDIPAQFNELALQIARTKVIHVMIIVFLVVLEGETLKNLGFHRIKIVQQLLVGLGFGLVLFLLINVGLNTVLNSLWPKAPGTGISLLSYFTDTRNLFVWLLIGIFGGGFVEELVRIFTLTRFEKAFGTAGLYVALLLSSIVFGFGHIYQGTASAVSTGLSGFILGLMFIRRRSAVEVITVHAFSDVLAILAAYALAR
jgi:membrane protease YdiL (CAAX protease family)